MNKRRHNHIRIIKCRECGKETVTGSGSGKYCNKCRGIVLKRQNKELGRKEKLERKRKLDLKCKECGVSLTNILYAKYYCLTCRPKVCKEKAKKASKKYYKKNREKSLAYVKEYYQIPKNKLKHRIQAKNSARKKALHKKMSKYIYNN